MIAVALTVIVVMLATPTYLLLHAWHAGHDRPVRLPEYAGADESWSPRAAFADTQAADWDEGAQLHAQLDAMQERWVAELDAIEVMALALLANSCDDSPTRDLVLLAGVAG